MQFNEKIKIYVYKSEALYFQYGVLVAATCSMLDLVWNLLVIFMALAFASKKDIYISTNPHKKISGGLEIYIYGWISTFEQSLNFYLLIL